MDEARKPTYEPDAETLAALRAWKDVYGDKWKKKLSIAWQNAGYPRVEAKVGAVLQQMRNTRGAGEWLRAATLD